MPAVRRQLLTYCYKQSVTPRRCLGGLSETGFNDYDKGRHDLLELPEFFHFSRDIFDVWASKVIYYSFETLPNYFISLCQGNEQHKYLE